MENEAVAVKMASLSAETPTEAEGAGGAAGGGLGPAKLLPHLQVWFQEPETRLIHEKETVAGAQNASQLASALHNCQVLASATSLSG